MKQFAIIVTALLILSVAMNIRLYTDVETITETETKYETIPSLAPPVHDTVRESPREIIVNLTKADGEDTAVIFLSEQRHYVDSTYEAWVSGVDAVLDSIRVFQRTKIVQVTKRTPEYKYVTTPTIQDSKIRLNGFVGGTTSIDFARVNLQGGLAVEYKDISLRGGYNLSKEDCYPFIGIEYKIK